VGIEPVEYVPLETAYALRWTATDGLLEPAALVDAATASDFEGFREALRGVSCPGQNVVYADVDGTIGYQLTGRYPIRRAGDGTVPVPGWTSEHDWDGWVPYEELPWSANPVRGFVVTANNRTHDEGYPHLIGRDFHASFRARRIAECLTGALDADAMAALQVDVRSLAAAELLPHLGALEARNDDQRWALGLIAGWDAEMTAGSIEAAVYNAWLSRIAWRLLGAPRDRGTYDRYFARREWLACRALASMLARDPAPWSGVERWDDLLLDALDDALALLEDRLGPDRAAWRWGALHMVRFAHPLARMPGFAPLFVAAEHELGGDEQTVLQAGFDARDDFRPAVVPSWRLVADLADVDRSAAVLPTGESGNPASPHWNDQTDLWISGRLRPAPVTRPAVEAAAAHRLSLLPDR
jgi:penicillin amidase